MAAPQIAPLPQSFDLTGGMQIVVTALNASTGAVVSGVAISSAYADVEYEEPAQPVELTNPVFLPNFSLGDVAA